MPDGGQHDQGCVATPPVAAPRTRAALPRIGRRTAAPRPRAAAWPLRAASRARDAPATRRSSLGLPPWCLEGQLGLTHWRALPPRAAGKTPEEIRKTFNIKNDFTPVRCCGAQQRGRDVALISTFCALGRRRRRRSAARTSGRSNERRGAAPGYAGGRRAPRARRRAVRSRRAHPPRAPGTHARRPSAPRAGPAGLCSAPAIKCSATRAQPDNAPLVSICITLRRPRLCAPPPSA